MGDDTRMCPCCGQARPFPTKPGLWEYMENPCFDEEGKVYDNYPRGLKPKGWIRVNMVDGGAYGDGYAVGSTILLVPLGSRRAAEWPDKALWRKVADEPSIAWQDVICEGYRLGDGKWMGKRDEEGEDIHEKQAD